MKLPINVIAVMFLVASGIGLGTQYLFDQKSHPIPALPPGVTQLLEGQGFRFAGRRPLSAEGETAGYFFETPDCRPPLIVVPVASPKQGSMVQWAYAAAHDKRVFFLYEGSISDRFPEASFIIGEAWRAGQRLLHGQTTALMPVLSIVRDSQCGRHAAVDWQKLDEARSSTL